MTQDLMSGYTAYADADELVTATGEAPATPIIIATAASAAFATSFAASVSTVANNC